MEESHYSESGGFLSAPLPAGALAGVAYVASTWVGIDGDQTSGDIVQAGCDATVTMTPGGPQPRYSVWYEWFPGNTSFIDGLTVSAGDILDVQIGVAEASLAGASILVTNRTTGQSRPVGVSVPNGSSFVGNCAEWIVEANGDLGPLAQYSPVSFSDCFAGLRGGAALSAGSGNAINMVAGGAILSAGAVAGTTVDVIYV